MRFHRSVHVARTNNSHVKFNHIEENSWKNQSPKMFTKRSFYKVFLLLFLLFKAAGLQIQNWIIGWKTIPHLYPPIWKTVLQYYNTSHTSLLVKFILQVIIFITKWFVHLKKDISIETLYILRFILPEKLFYIPAFL